MTIETTKPTDPYKSGFGDQYGELLTRDFNIKIGNSGNKVTIVQLTDLHIRLIDDNNSYDKNNKTLQNTKTHRNWPDQYNAQRNLNSALDYYESLNADQLIITGDALDCLSMGGLNYLKEKIWNRFGKYNVLIAPGNHELIQNIQDAKVKVDNPETETAEARYKLLKDNWGGTDPIYESRVLQNKVMVITMDNGLNDRDEIAKPHFGKLFHDEQVAMLTDDLKLARQNGYAVLLFMHSPIGTGNPADTSVQITYDPDTPTYGSGVGKTQNLYENVAAGTPNNGDSAASAAIWNLIYENSDIVAAVFAGHVHGDFYSEIIGKTRKIPQILLRGMCYEQGHALKITVEY